MVLLPDWDTQGVTLVVADDSKSYSSPLSFSMAEVCGRFLMGSLARLSPGARMFVLYVVE